ncbi:TetR/AcrR family transcriptional regulator [Pseudonocardia sp. HH130630-07]|uniref:TetR/AcrR family transcriptional regulator n=1 Tax=Pseudonocardia sp. HH130630-07 TaxID=1690815 RepID=UPI000814E158|nr:TetR/AcrR family transcriptional regulator [Pseudonocardia sp. HH130630-07]ANY07235.1 hypothetical protein AFB00_14155 [Pseudonocardia sp. HH130630-07]
MPRANLGPTTVVEAAAVLADRDGYDAVTVSAVARELGVKPASLYAHVRDRAALLAGVHRMATGELGHRVADAVAGRSERAALTGLADAHRSYARERPGAWAALNRPVTPVDAGSAEIVRLAGLTVAVLRGYGIDEAELAHAMRFVAATLSGFLGLSGSGAFDPPDLVETSWVRTLDALDRALRAWPSSS